MAVGLKGTHKYGDSLERVLKHNKHFHYDNTGGLPGTFYIHRQIFFATDSVFTDF